MHVPDVVIPETHPAAPRRSRKSKPVVSAPPKRERSKRVLPVKTLERAVAAFGEHHAEALRVLSQRDPSFKAGLRAEIEFVSHRAKAQRRVDEATRALNEANVALAKYPAVPPRDHRDRLDRLARTIAETSGALDVDSDPSDSRLDDEAACKASAIVDHRDPRNFPS